MDWKKKCCASGLATGSRTSLSGCNVSSCSWENASFPTVERETHWVALAKVFAESWDNSTAVRRPANFVEFQWPYFSQDRIFWQQWDRSCCLNFFMHNCSRISSTWYMFAQQFYGPVAPRSSVRLVYTGKILKKRVALLHYTTFSPTSRFWKTDFTGAVSFVPLVPKLQMNRLPRPRLFCSPRQQHRFQTLNQVGESIKCWLLEKGKPLLLNLRSKCIWTVHSQLVDVMTSNMVYIYIYTSRNGRTRAEASGVECV